MTELFDLANAQQQEAQRRLRMLGDYATTKYERGQLRKLASERAIPVRYLADWKHLFQLYGIEGLFPCHWTPLTEKDQHLVLKRLQTLGSLAESLIITNDDIASLAQQLQCSLSTAIRLVRRYRIGGLWGLAPRYNPEKAIPQNQKPTPAALASHENDEMVLREIERKRQILGERILHKIAVGESLSNAEVTTRAQEVSKSERSLWGYIRDMRRYGNRGLVRRARSDKGKLHNVSERMEHIIRGLRLSKPDCTLDEVHQEACRRAHALGEPEPSPWQVRSICERIPAEVKLVADGRETEFRNKYRFTYRRRFDGTCIIYQIDATRVDVLVKDTRKKGFSTKSGEIRPWLTTCIESCTRTLMAASFSYEDPNQHTIAAAIRDALLVTEQKTYGGIPDEIWVDRGKAMISKHIQNLALDLGIELHDCATPEQKGIVERFFRTLNTRLWARQPGYVHSNVQDRNPKAKATLTIPELAEKFWEFIHAYHQEVHSETKAAPLQAWMDTCFALPGEPRQLDILLQIKEFREARKEGISYASRVYWHDSLMESVSVGDQVLIRAAPAYSRPDEIQVFYQGNWICSAFARDSDLGRAVTGKRVVEAQRQQRSRIRHVIHDEREVLHQLDPKITQKSQVQGEDHHDYATASTTNQVTPEPLIGQQILVPSSGTASDTSSTSDTTRHVTKAPSSKLSPARSPSQKPEENKASQRTIPSPTTQRSKTSSKSAAKNPWAELRATIAAKNKEVQP